MLARLGELPALVLDFFEQSHVLDGDHCLVGEGGEQLDLLIGERCNLRLPQELLCRAARPRAARVPPASSENPSVSALPGNHIPGPPRRLRFGPYGAPAARDPGTDGGALPQLQASWRGIVGGSGSAAFAIVAVNHAVLGTANADSILQQRLKDALEVEYRPADGLEHLGRTRRELNGMHDAGMKDAGFATISTKNWSKT